MTDYNLRLDEFELDAFGETANIGFSHAATALSQMMGQRIGVSIPQVALRTADALPDSIAAEHEPVASAVMEVLGDVTGHILFVQSHDDAIRLADVLLGLQPGTTTEFGGMAESCFREVSNILGATYLNALASFLGVSLLPSVPFVALGSRASVLATETGAVGGEGLVLSAETALRVGSSVESLVGYMLFFPSRASIDTMLAILMAQLQVEPSR